MRRLIRVRWILSKKVLVKSLGMLSFFLFIYMVPLSISLCVYCPSTGNVFASDRRSITTINPKKSGDLLREDLPTVDVCFKVRLYSFNGRNVI